MKKFTVFIVLMSLLVGCGGKEGTKTGSNSNITISQEDATKSFVLNGKQYTIPCKLSEFGADGWKVKDADKEPMPAKSFMNTDIVKGDERIWVTLVNHSDTESFDDIEVSAIYVSASLDADEFYFYEGLNFESKVDEIKKKFDFMSSHITEHVSKDISYQSNDTQIQIEFHENGNAASVNFVDIDKSIHKDYKHVETKEIQKQIDNMGSKEVESLNELYGGRINTQFTSMSAEDVKKEGDMNYDKYPLTKIESNEGELKRIYKIEGVVETILEDSTDLIMVKDKSGLEIEFAQFSFNLVTDKKLAEGDKVTLYVSDVFVIKDPSNENYKKLGGLVILADINGTSYSYYK